MAELRVDAIRVHYRESGRGPPVVLLHGGGSSGAQWRGVVRLLEHRYRLVTVDHYGHGGTDPWPGPPEARTHDAEALLVRAVMDTLGGPVHLVGHSYGGGVALRLVQQAPEAVRSLVLLEPIALSILEHQGEGGLADTYREFARAFIRDARAGELERAWERFIDGNGEPGNWACLDAAARERFIAMTEHIVSGWHANLNHATTPAECRGIALSTLLLHGERTRPHFQRIPELLAELIPQSRPQVLPDAGHMASITHPHAVAGALAAHLDAVP